MLWLRWLACGIGVLESVVDETYSWRAAHASLAGVFTQVRASEVAPLAYYLLLHFWIGLLGSDSEWTMRLLSALAAIALVGAVWWLAASPRGGRELS